MLPHMNKLYDISLGKNYWEIKIKKNELLCCNDFCIKRGTLTIIVLAANSMALLRRRPISTPPSAYASRAMHICTRQLHLTNDHCILSLDLGPNHTST